MPDKLELFPPGSPDLLSVSRANTLISAVNSLLGIKGTNGIDVYKADSNVLIDGSRLRVPSSGGGSVVVLQVTITAIGPEVLTVVTMPQTSPPSAAFNVARPPEFRSSVFEGQVIDGVTYGPLNSATSYNTRSASSADDGSYIEEIKERYRVGDTIYVVSADKTVLTLNGNAITLIDLNVAGRHWTGPNFTPVRQVRIEALLPTGLISVVPEPQTNPASAAYDVAKPYELRSGAIFNSPSGVPASAIETEMIKPYAVGQIIFVSRSDNTGTTAKFIDLNVGSKHIDYVVQPLDVCVDGFERRIRYRGTLPYMPT